MKIFQKLNLYAYHAHRTAPAVPSRWIEKKRGGKEVGEKRWFRPTFPVIRHPSPVPEASCPRHVPGPNGAPRSRDRLESATTTSRNQVHAQLTAAPVATKCNSITAAIAHEPRRRANRPSPSLAPVPNCHLSRRPSCTFCPASVKTLAAQTMFLPADVTRLNDELCFSHSFYFCSFASHQSHSTSYNSTSSLPSTHAFVDLIAPRAIMDFSLVGFAVSFSFYLVQLPHLASSISPSLRQTCHSRLQILPRPLHAPRHQTRP